LWGTMPDDELWAHAKAGDLIMPDQLRSQVTRLLASPRAAGQLNQLLNSWYGLDGLSAHPADPAYPGYTPELQADMRMETQLFFQDLVQNNRNPLSLLTGDQTFMNDKIAALYGIPGITGSDFRPVSLVGTGRAGILTQPSILTMTSTANKTSI